MVAIGKHCDGTDASAATWLWVA